MAKLIGLLICGLMVTFSSISTATETRSLQSIKVDTSKWQKLDQTDSKGENALLRAVKNKDIKAVSKLLAQGANVNFLAKSGVSPLFLAVQARSYELAQLLMEGGANPNLTGKKGSPLKIAKKSRDQKMLEILDPPARLPAKVASNR